MEKSGNVPIAIEWSAPRDGVVLEHNVVEGMQAKAGDVLFRIADLPSSGCWPMWPNAISV